MNGHVEKEDLVERHWRSLESSPQAYQWKDIQDDFAMWSLDLEEGELLSICNFSLYDAMSAIELMDAKMDIGLLLKDRKIKSFEEGVECGAVKMKDFSAAEYLGLIDRSLSNFILWIQGHCLAQTLFTLVYLHQPQKLEDDLLKAYCWCLLALTEHVRQIMIDGCVIEEEDFQVSSLIPAVSSETCPPRASVLLKSLKSCEELCSKNSRRHRLSLKDNTEQSEDDESHQWNALALRFKFCRIILHFFGSFSDRNDNFFMEAPQQMDALQGTIDKILTEYNPSEEAFRNAWGFEPLINLHLLPPSFPRHTPVTLDSGTFIFFGKLCHQLKLVGLLRDKLKSMEGLMYFLRTEGSALDLALTRSMVQIVIGLSIELKRAPSGLTGSWVVSSATDFMLESLRLFSNPPVLMAGFSQYESHGQMKEYAQTFVRSALALSSSILRMQGLNKARQRDSLATCLLDLFSLQDDAEKLDEYFTCQMAELKLTGMNHTFCFGSWTLTTMLNTMTDYLFCGLELQLYAHTELHFVYWYLYDVLLHCQVQTIIRADSAARENEIAWKLLQETDVKHNKKKNGKKKQNGGFKSSLETASRLGHGIYLARAQALHHLSGAFHFALLGLQWQEKIKMPDQSLDCEEFRYYHRLMPFMERNAPAFVDYQHYQIVKSLMARNDHSPPISPPETTLLDCIRDAYVKSSYNFQQADRYLASWANVDEKNILSKVCKRNDVIVRILASGRTCKSVEIKFDIHPFFPSLKIF